MSTFNAVSVGVYTQLTGGTALIGALGGTLIYQAQAPDGAALPYVVYSHQAGGPLNITPEDLRDAVVYVRAYAATPKQAGELDALISARLHRQDITITGYTVMACERETDISQTYSLPGGQAAHSAGALYRIRLT